MPDKTSGINYIQRLFLYTTFNIIFYEVIVSYYGQCKWNVLGVLLSVQARCYHSQFMVAAVCHGAPWLVVDAEEGKELA